MDALFICHNYENRYNIGNHHFRLELCSRFDKVTFYGPGYENFDEVRPSEILSQTKPDVVFFLFPTRDYERGEKYVTEDYSKFSGLKVLYDTDSQSSIYSRCLFCNKNKVDHVFLANNYKFIADHNEILDRKDRVYWLPFGVDTEFFRDLGLERENEILFLGCTNELHYLNRIHLVAVMKRTFGPRFFFNPSNEINGLRYVDILNRYKIFTSAGDRYQGFFMKYLEVMACGCMLISQSSPSFKKLGLNNGEHLVEYDNFNDLIDKSWYYLGKKEEREGIASRGREKVLKEHTWSRRVDQMMEILYG